MSDLTALFTREALRPFQPAPGSQGLTPILEVTTPKAVAVFVLALDGFDDWATRQCYLRALGTICAQDYPGVTLVRFGSEAWLQTLTPEEAAARGNRLMETSPDQEEVILVFGQAEDGTMILAHAKLSRRATGEVERLGAWTVKQEDATFTIRQPILEAFWDGYRAGQAGQN